MVSIQKACDTDGCGNVPLTENLCSYCLVNKHEALQAENAALREAARQALTGLKFSLYNQPKEQDVMNDINFLEQALSECVGADESAALKGGSDV